MKPLVSQACMHVSLKTARQNHTPKHAVASSMPLQNDETNSMSALQFKLAI